MIGFGQVIKPEIYQSYKTNTVGYSACKSEYSLNKILKASDNIDNVTFMKYHNNGDCIVLGKELIVKVVNIKSYRSRIIVELKKEGTRASLWTVAQALKEY